MPPYCSHIALILCLASAGQPLLASPTLPATPRRAPAQVRQTAPASPLGWLWNHLTTVWAAAGCGIDPSGVACASSLAPSGHTMAVPPAPAGCGIDPDGHC
jgi:hypothetical protein